MCVNGITVCRSCPSFIHRQCTEKQPGRDLRTLNSLDLLLQQAEVQRSIGWGIKQAKRIE